MTRAQKPHSKVKVQIEGQSQSHEQKMCPLHISLTLISHIRQHAGPEFQSCSFKIKVVVGS